MQTYDPEQPLINLHIQKCAGQSFRKVLEAWYRENFYLHRYNQTTGEVTDKVVKAGDRYPPGICIHGHFQKRLGFGVNEYYPDIKQFITVLRDPLERQLSLYFFQKNRIAKGLEYRAGRQINKTPYKSVDDYLKYSMKRPPYYANHFPWPINRHNFKDILEEHFIHIGIAERLQDSVRIFAEKLGKPLANVRVINASQHDEQTSPAVVEQFRQSTELEYLIYTHAVDLNPGP